jgi:predicted nuclease of predicted toxin-antitoxin system
MRFLADENVSRLVVERLRANGFEVLSIAETRSGAPDKDVLATASAEKCILVTEDRDYGELVIRQRLAIDGVILLDWIACRTRRRPMLQPRLFLRTGTGCSVIWLWLSQGALASVHCGRECLNRLTLPRKPGLSHVVRHARLHAEHPRLSSCK